MEPEHQVYESEVGRLALEVVAREGYSSVIFVSDGHKSRRSKEAIVRNGLVVVELWEASSSCTI